ncbi:MAG: helix-turn-helix domain-containing protein [Candidatus Binatia bacterium]
MDMVTLKRLFGRRVRSLRKLRDLTQEKLAEATSLSAEYVSKVERGLTSPSFEVIAKLAEALQVDPSMLFDFSELHGSRHGDK